MLSHSSAKNNAKHMSVLAKPGIHQHNQTSTLSNHDQIPFCRHFRSTVLHRLRNVLTVHPIKPQHLHPKKLKMMPWIGHHLRSRHSVPYNQKRTSFSQHRFRYSLLLFMDVCHQHRSVKHISFAIRRIDLYSTKHHPINSKTSSIA